MCRKPAHRDVFQCGPTLSVLVAFVLLAALLACPTLAAQARTRPQPQTQNGIVNVDACPTDTSLCSMDGVSIVALGDVSGKSLKAAMTGTLAIGALRTLAVRGLGPAELLAALNEEMVAGQHGGFITMLCARIEANGKVTLANAGHLHPYRGGEEIELEAGLPLGIVSGLGYAEREITLAPGERLTLISDGIVEARRTDGELFGFERTQAGSTATAQQMAEIAQKLGQEDDITVLTLTREGAADAIAVPMVPSPSPA